MHYQFSKDSTNQQNDQRKPSGARKKTVYDFNAFKFSYDSSKDNVLDDSISIVSQRNSIEQAEQFPSQIRGQSTSFQQQNMSRDLYHNSAEPFHENKQTHQKRQTPMISSLQRSEQPEKQLFYQQKIHKPEPRIVLEIRQCSKDECSKPSEPEKEEEDVVSDQLVYQPFTETFRNMTIHDLIDQCEDHVGVINTCNTLHKIITEELMKQVKLDDIVCQKLTARAQRLQQQTVFLEKVQAPIWMKTALDDLITRATQRAQAYKIHAAHLLKECQTVQCSMDETVDVMKATTPAAADRSQETKDDEETRNETSLVSTQTSKTTDDVVDKLRCKSFLQIHDTFEAIRKPLMKLLSLLEYQQEQYDATLMQMEQVENEIEQLVSNGDVDNSPWRAQIKKKNLETKKELLEARREHLETDMSNAKKEISEFELNNRDKILDVLNELRQQRNRCDSGLRENFQLLLTASLRDPTCFRQHVDKPQPRTDDEETSNNRQTSFAEKLHEPRKCVNSSENRFNPLQMCSDASCGQETTCTSFKNQESFQTKNNAAPNVPNNADFISKPPLRDFKGSKFQNNRHLYSYMLLSDSESGLGDKINVADVSPMDAIKGRYVNTKQDYGTDGFKSPSDFNYSRAVKDSPISTASEGICEERMDESASPVGYDDSKTTSWSVSSSQAEQQCHKQFKSSVYVDDTAEKTSQMNKEEHDKHPFTVQHPSLYQDICGREYNSQRFQVGITEQSTCIDDYEKDIARSHKYFRTGITAPTPDVLSNKEVRAAYFINKYAGGRHNDRSFLMKNMHGVRPLAWRGTKDFSTKKLGRSCHGNGSKKHRDSLTKLGSSKQKIDSKTMIENTDGVEEVDSSSCQDAYSDNSVADDENMDLQKISLEHPK